MKLAIVGSRDITDVDIGKYIPDGVTEIVSGGAKGIDMLAKQYAIDNNIKYTEFAPDYTRFKKGAPLKRNQEIAKYADAVLVFWDCKSKGTKHTIKCFELLQKEIIKITI
jgi:predicted Rossmann fold nucleotide-binding protein DprA/Smf involved in DNA uptake